MTCTRCNGRRGGQSTGAAKRRSWKKAMAARWAWKVGDRVTGRLKHDRWWSATIIVIGHGRPGRRWLVCTVSDGSATKFKEANVVRVHE